MSSSCRGTCGGTRRRAGSAAAPTAEIATRKYCLRCAAWRSRRTACAVAALCCINATTPTPSRSLALSLSLSRARALSLSVCVSFDALLRVVFGYLYDTGTQNTDGCSNLGTGFGHFYCDRKRNGGTANRKIYPRSPLKS